MWSWIWGWADRIGVVLREVGLPTTLLIGILSVCMVLTRQPARRLMLARAGVFLLPVLAILTGFHLLPRYDLVAAAARLGVVPDSMPFSGSLASSLLEPRPLVVKAGTVLWIGRVLTMLYLAGVVAGLARLALGFVGLSWLTARATRPSDEAMAVYESIPRASGRRRPRLLVVERIGRPVLVGLFRPTILIPPTVDQPEALDQLRLSLLHELAHVEGLDPLFGLLSNFAQVFWFVFPPVWWVAAWMRLDQEFLADRRAANDYGPLGEYATSLLAFAKPGIVLGRPRVRRDDPGEGSGAGSPLFQRVLMLVRCPFPVERRPPIWWTLGLVCLAIPLTVGLASISPTTRIGRGPFTTSAIDRVNAFPLTSLTVPPMAPGVHGRSPLFELPVRLPEEFDLYLEVWGDLSTLVGTRVAGLLLATPEFPTIDADAPPSWHKVRIKRDHSGVSLWINGQEALSDRETRSLTTWLSVESAPNREGRFQKLRLSW
jgi:beta-lactamase regulating signal transducer with metallopeptidase domain